jgi:predicted nucleic acid-binding protein
VVVIDTSIWISHLVPADAHHASTNVWLNTISARPQRFSVPAIFLAEVSGVLARIDAPDAFVSDTVGQIDRSDRFNIAAISLGQAMLAADIARMAKIRGSDAVFVALAISLEIPLVTWDKQQRERGAVFCRTMTPVEVMEMAE